ncbi:MAG: putative nucleotide-diphospho-sugar transferase [Pseudomonadota bacterium]
MGRAPSAEQTDRANHFHQCYQQLAGDRLKTLSKLLRQCGDHPPIIAMMFGASHLHFFRNWVASCDRHKIDTRGRTIVFAMDTVTESTCDEMSFHSCPLHGSGYAAPSVSRQFGDTGFRQCMFYKNAVIADLLELGADVLFQDADLIWLRDPIVYLNSVIAEMDLLMMYDGAGPSHYPFYFNTGFMYFKNTPASEAIIDTALRNTASIFMCGGHQRPMNRIIGHHVNQNVAIAGALPESLFLNGHLFNLVRGVNERAGDWKNTGYVMHYSWTRDRAEKHRKIRQFGLDYLNDGTFDSDT